MVQITQDIETLRTVSERVDSADEAREIITKIQDTISKISHGVGLAAIQISIPKRVSVIKNVNKRPGDDEAPDFYYLINAEIIEEEEETIHVNEGCLSFPNTYLNTKRYRHVVIKNQRINEDNELEDETLYFYDPKEKDVFGDRNSDNIVCYAVQHEIDHFLGKLIIDHEIKSEPIKNKNKKIGRNDPCPCGSGKKYKKCCG